MPLEANEQRLWASLMEMAKIGATPNGGCSRLALTDEDKAARDLFVAWCREAGCEIAIDRLGDIFARRAGAEPARPPVLSGSHLDTQPHGGRFDGVYGVLAALEVIRCLNDAGLRTHAPIEAVVWSNEEGVRFQPGLLASGVVGGLYDLDEILAARDPDGAVYRDELERIGYAGQMAVGGRALNSFFEAHIEQGPVLEAEGKTVGVVDRVQGLRWFQVTLEGQDSHAGTTPMALRRDAAAGAAEMILALEAMGRAEGPEARVTVGRIDVVPNAPSTIPGRVAFFIDLRNPSAETLARQEAGLRTRLAAIAAARGLGLTIERGIEIPPVAFDPDCVAAVRAAAEALGIPHRDITSGALHDACCLSRVAPTAMVFVPCKDGLSHNEAESATPADLAAGTSVLLNAILARAGVAG